MPSTELAPDQVQSDLKGLVARLIDEMANSWRAEDRLVAEDFLARFPELLQEPTVAAELIYEEFCLRRERGEFVDSNEFMNRFPQWRTQLARLFDCAQLFDAAPAARRWPQPGESVAGFRLLYELGRGAVGRVYLANQAQLAGRLVVLKVTPHDGREHLSLARLQHTHIVPLYSVHDDAARDLRISCMPYFGGATLDRVLGLLSVRAAAKRRGLDILDALDKCRAAADVLIPARAPAARFLAHASYVHTICSIGVNLADALHYAHTRGLVHLDLKTSNVLITYEGQPMLLDFHLAREPIPAGSTAPESLGGTVDYMSPEQLAAVDAVRAGGEIPDAVDCRSDVYSLGLVLYEALGGPIPQRSHEWPPVNQFNHQVSIGLADIIGKCLAPKPDDRYCDAASLAEDLRRHLADLPLRRVANRSLVERWGKWRRRWPTALPIAVMVSAVLAASAAVALVARAHTSQRRAEARTALDDGIRDLNAHHYSEATHTLKRGLAAAQRLQPSDGLKAQLINTLARAEANQLAQDLHTVTERLRLLDASELIPSDSLRKLEEHCHTLWESRRVIVEHGDRDDAQWGNRIRVDLSDLALLWSDLRVRLADSGTSQSSRAQAIRVLDEIQALGVSSPVFSWERQRYDEQFGAATDSAESIRREARDWTPQTAWESYALGRILLREGELKRAAQWFDQVVQCDPSGLWPNFYSGVCAYRLSRFDDAVVAFTACIGAAPDLAECYYNRALAYERLGRPDRALSDYTFALQLQPKLVAARLNRAVLYLHANRYSESAADLKQALDDGANPAIVQYNLALVQSAAGDRSGER